MPGLQLAGLASGLDWKSLVDQLILADSAPVTRMQTQQAQLTQQNSALNTLKTKLEALQTSMASLKEPAAFSQRTTNVGNTLWAASAGTTAAATAHSITVNHLATTSRLAGASDIASPLRADGDTTQMLVSGLNLGQSITAGQFTVNGARVSVAVTDTLDEVFQKIGTATGGAVTASYDGGTDRVTLTGSGPVVLGSANDSSNFLRALKLGNNGTGTVSSATQLGSARLDAPLSTAGFAGTLSGLDGDNAGKLVINGAEISYDTDTDSLRTVIARINASSAGVTASFDPENDRLLLTNNVTGDLGVSVQDNGGNLSSVLGLAGTGTLQRGQNAEFTVNGGEVRTSVSNTLDETALGVAGLTVTVGSETTERISVNSDTAATRTKIEDFIAKFNDVQTYIEQQTKTTVAGTKVTNGVLTGNLEVAALARSLRTEAFKAFAGGTGGVTRLDSLGIDFQGTASKLVVKDTAKLDSALLGKSEDVKSFFTSATTGLSARFDGLIKRQTDITDGGLTRQVELRNKQSASLTKQIADAQRRLEAQRTSMEARFTQMELMQSKLQSQLQSLTNASSSANSR